MGKANSKQIDSQNVTDEIIVDGFIKYFFRQNFNNSNSNTLQTFPDAIINIVYNYYHLWFIWDIESNKDKKLNVSKTASTFTSTADKTTYTSHKVYSSIL